MKLSVQQLEEGIKLLGRSLLSLAPDYANGALANEQAIAQEAASRGKALVEVWLKIQTGASHYFIWVGKDQGNYKRELPADVHPAKVITIQVDPAFRPVNQMIQQFASILEGLAADSVYRDVKAGAFLELADPAADQPLLAGLKSVLSQLAAASADDYNRNTLTTLSRPLQNSIFASVKKQNLDETKYQLQCLKQAGIDLRAALGADCLLAGWLRIYPDICDLVMKRCQLLGMDEKSASVQWVRYVGSGCAPGANNPPALIHGMIDKGVREDLGELMSELAQVYCDEGEVLVEQALAAKTVDAWDEALYGACLEFFLGNRIYEGLARSARPADAARLPRYKTAKNTAEEQQTLVANALLFGLKNRDGSGLARHREQLRRTRKTAGEAAVEKLANDFIERQYFYPRSFKPVLLDLAA